MMDKFKVRNMASYKGTGDTVANQFRIEIATEKGFIEVFQSYKTIIAVKDENGCVTLDKDNWNYSTTTSRYRNQFLNEKTAETRKKIESGEYKLANLN